MTALERLAELGIDLPAVTPPPAAAYVPWRRSGSLIFISGHIARKDGAPHIGQLGAGVSVQEGAQAARRLAIDLLATLRAAADLDRVRLLKLLVLVNGTPTFTQQPAVANGASELFIEVLGERGAHARSAVGVAQLPFGACVEIELVAEEV
jgi:enamine deaminase RidA (YjgF/YER057c/UK114 family)